MGVSSASVVVMCLGEGHAVVTRQIAKDAKSRARAPRVILAYAKAKKGIPR